jgi:hypothetical protein
MKFKFEELKSKLKPQWPWLIIIPVMIAFFVLSSSFNYKSQTKDFVKWLSPDETANYTVAKLYAETRSLAFFEKYNLISKDIIHPRSFRSDWGLIKPVSFLGLPIYYGKIARVFGVGILPYLTPIIGALGLVFFYLLIKRIFGKSNALISTLIAAGFPVYIYFSARSMFHNILFMAALIAGLYFAVRMTEQNKEATTHLKKHYLGYIFALCAGLCVGLSLTARTSELLWVGPLFVGLWLFNIRRIGIIRLFFFVYGVFMAFFPVIYWNTVLYGSVFSSGYPELTNSLFALQQNGSALASTAAAGKFTEIKTLLGNIKATIFHFGFKPAQSYTMFTRYVQEMFPWLYWSAIAGVAVFIVSIKHYTKERWLYILAWLSISTILVLYYGSWIFYDNPDPKSFTIGNSYTRYWLPLYFGAIPLASLALIKITSFVRNQAAIWAIRAIAVTVVIMISIQFVWNDPAEGLAVSIQKQNESRNEFKQVLDATENNAVIITRYHDKLLFPERKVVIGLFNDPNMITEYAHIAARAPVYYYNFSYQPEDLNYLNNGVLKENAVHLSEVKPITSRFTLYKMEIIKEAE